MSQDLLTTQQVADARGVTRSTVYNWIDLGKLPAQWIDGEMRVKPEDLDKLEKPRRGRKKRSSLPSKGNEK